MLATIAIARWYGVETFTDFTVDLAILGLFLILLEVIPSNYAVFKVQDNPEWLHSVSSVQMATIIALLILLIMSFHFGWFFNQYSIWMFLYIIVSAGKRFLDIRLQSAGRLSEYLKVEAWTALVRLPIIISGIMLGITSPDVLWGSLAFGMALAQSVWWINNKADLKYLRSFKSAESWNNFYDSKNELKKYYLGTLFKRIKDNSIPILADLYFQSKNALAVFFLSYRGLVFVVGQVRIIEALINHRETLDKFNKLNRNQKMKVIILAQIACIAVSYALTVATGIKESTYSQFVALSFMVWPICFYSFERAKTYSFYAANAITWSLAAYISVLFLSTFSSHFFGHVGALIFIFCLFISEAISLYVLKHKSYLEIAKIKKEG